MAKQLPTYDAFTAPTDDRITQEQLDKDYWKLPLALRQKIKPEPVLSPADKAKKKAKFAKMNATIFPVKFRPGYLAVTSARAGSRTGAPGAGGCPPITNRGGKSVEPAAPKLASLEAKEKLIIVAVGYRGKSVFVRIPRPDKGSCDRHAFLDWVNFTWKVDKHPLELATGHIALTDHDYVQALSAELYQIFGYGVSRQRESGMNFFSESYELGENGWGLVCIGGQKGSISVTVKGQGLMAALPGWELRLFNFLTSIPDSRLTRVDLAADNFHSTTSLDDYLSMYHAGLFVNRGRAPNIEQAGNWVKPNGKGRTLYIGGRTSGKLLRIYEKGLQLANGFHEKFPNWIRVELELKNQDRIIPFDVLLRPGQYLAGAYPALKRFHQVQERIETFKKVAESTLERVVETTRHQFGRHIWALTEYFGTEKAVELLTADKDQLPKSLATVIEFQTRRPETDYLHTQPILKFQTTKGDKSWRNSTY
jgi:phage replication initiation protein